MAESLYNFKSFLGIDNTSDLVASRIKGRSGIYFFEADNLDIDDNFKPHRRDGDLEKIVTSTTVHSLWSDRGSNCFFVDSTILYKLNTDYSTTALINGVDPTDRMAFLKVNQTVYFSNNSIIGYIVNDLPYPFPDPDQTFKMKMVGGHILEFYNSRLYAASGANLFYSDATLPMQMDKRKNAIAFPDRITMVKAVMDGLYVSADDKTFFLKGNDPSTFIQIQIMDDAAVEGSGIAVEGDDIGKGKIKGRAIYFIADGTVYKGYPQGVVVPYQDALFFMDNLEKGTAIFKDDHGYSQYVAICELSPGTGGSSGEFSMPMPVIE